MAKRARASGFLTDDEYLEKFACFDLECPKCGLFLFRGSRNGGKQSYICAGGHSTVRPTKLGRGNV